METTTTLAGHGTLERQRLATLGSITANVRANASAGFSIVSYSGNSSSATIGHGLNDAPRLLIIKNRSIAINWRVYTTAIDGSMDYGTLNATDAFAGSALSTPTSSVFSLVSSTSINATGNDYIAYCFAPVAGYSAFGSYTGNASTDGPFVFTGFRPRWIMIKRYNTTGSWMILDAARNPENLVNHKLSPNSNAEEDNNSIVGSGDKNSVDFLSNGFKLRSTNGETNGGSQSFFYACFAEHPLKTARAR